jgi:pyrroloquinoline quinone (PQQ) biosynthesis protein C
MWRYQFTVEIDVADERSADKTAAALQAVLDQAPSILRAKVSGGYRLNGWPMKPESRCLHLRIKEDKSECFHCDAPVDPTNYVIPAGPR